MSGHTFRAEAATLRIGDVLVDEGHGTRTIETVERAGGVTRVEAMGRSTVYPDDTRVLLALIDGKLPGHHFVRRVLGNAVHPRAVDRLFELWPEADVAVRHGDDRHDGVELKVTRVNIAKKRDPVPTAATPLALGDARCRLDCDSWDRRHGISLAFRRALQEVRRMAEREAA